MTKKSRERTETRINNRAEREDKFDVAIAQFEADIEAAGKIGNPAEKILKLDEIRLSIDKAVGEMHDATIGEAQDIASEARRAGDKAFILFMPTLIGPAIADEKRRKSVLKKLKAEAEGHWQKMADRHASMAGQRVRIGELINTTAENDVVKISQSSLSEKVFEVPGVTAIFARAAAKQIVVDAARLAEAAPGKKHSQAGGLRLIMPNA